MKIVKMTWVRIGAFYRLPDADNPDYFAHLDTSLSRIPEGADMWLIVDFNLGDNSVNGSASKPTLCSQLINIAQDRLLQQLVTETTRITEHSENILDLFSQTTDL